MEQVLEIYKNRGETPLMALERARKEHGILESVPMTYAGRLDPMAEGLMLVLVGEACKTKDQYNALGKTYEFELLSGMSTDTYDLLGLVTQFENEAQLDVEKVKKYLSDHIKTFSQNYPPYSSKTFEGKQLHTHTREGNTPIIMHEVSLYDFEFLEEWTILGKDLLQFATQNIELVHGDFRQEEIIKRWQESLSSGTNHEFQITKWRVSVSSGFYIRQLAHDIGEMFNVPTVTYSIKRTKIG